MIDILFQHLKIKGVFRLFDKDEDGDIPAQELGTALRALGAYPSVRDNIQFCRDALKVIF